MPAFQWLNQDEFIATASKAAYRILEEDSQRGYGNDSPNMLIKDKELHQVKKELQRNA